MPHGMNCDVPANTRTGETYPFAAVQAMLFVGLKRHANGSATVTVHPTENVVVWKRYADGIGFASRPLSIRWVLAGDPLQPGERVLIKAEAGCERYMDAPAYAIEYGQNSVVAIPAMIPPNNDLWRYGVALCTPGGIKGRFERGSVPAGFVDPEVVIKDDTGPGTENVKSDGAAASAPRN